MERMARRPRYIVRLEWLLKDSARLGRLLSLDKTRRGLPDARLAFVGMHNIAQYRWCALYAVLKSRACELDFYGAYLEDRLRYAFMCDVAEQLPDDDEAMLTLAEQDLQLARVEQVVRDLDGSGDGLNVAPLVAKEDDGIQFHEPDNFTFRWNFPWRHYVVSGVPDGIADDMGLEAKSSRTEFLSIQRQERDFLGVAVKLLHQRVPKDLSLVRPNPTASPREPASAPAQASGP